MSKQIDNMAEIKRGEQAEQLLDNPMYQEAIQKVHDGLISAMTSSALGDESTHHRLVIALQLLSQIERHIETVAQTGKMAKIQANDGIFGNIRAAAGF